MNRINVYKAVHGFGAYFANGVRGWAAGRTAEGAVDNLLRQYFNNDFAALADFWNAGAFEVEYVY